MSYDMVKTNGLSKRFYVLNRRGTLLQAIKCRLSDQRLHSELWALRNIDLEIARGEKLAIVGKNGSGKTTLLRIISGIYDATAGTIKVESVPKVIFSLSIGLNARLSLLDNIRLFGAVHGIDKKKLLAKQEEILDIAELGKLRYAPLKRLSMGQKQRLALSVFFQTEGDFFIFDESTAFVDIGFETRTKDRFERLFSGDSTVIIASHNTQLLRKYCSKALWLDDGQIRMQGDLGPVLDAYERETRND